MKSGKVKHLKEWLSSNNKAGNQKKTKAYVENQKKDIKKNS